MWAQISPQSVFEAKAEIIPDLYHVFSDARMSLVDVTWMQHRYHEKRRWSSVDLLAQVDVDKLSHADKVYIWNAGRAELTTKPGADRLARLADSECHRWLKTDMHLASVMQACGTWSRYWNEEESFHEATLNILAQRLGMTPISDETFIEFRKIFPDDNMLRTLFLLAISEITATVNYARCANHAKDDGLRALFRQIAADEAQHMRYFLSFSKALVDSRKYHAKDAFAIAHLFLREGGEIQGSDRTKVESRETHVNWWDQLETADIERPEDIEGKQNMVFSALEKVTGIRVTSVDEVEDVWMDLLEQ
jgi:hypothetical protein